MYRSTHDRRSPAPRTKAAEYDSARATDRTARGRGRVGKRRTHRLERRAARRDVALVAGAERAGP